MQYSSATPHPQPYSVFNRTRQGKVPVLHTISAVLMACKDGPINPADTGSPVIDKLGKVCGVARVACGVSLVLDSTQSYACSAAAWFCSCSSWASWLRRTRVAAPTASNRSRSCCRLRPPSRSMG
jgi:hypothetical protein